MPSVARSALTFIATFLLISSLHAQGACDEEVKLLLSPTQVQLAVPALRSRGETHRRIYFYDTPGLDLLKNSVVLRLREGVEIDITTKLRPRNGERFSDPSGGSERFKCEVNLIGGVENPSFSVEKKYVATKVPETGQELFQLLSEGQKQLLQDSQVQIDWKRVKRLSVIQSTTWTTRAKPPLGKLGLELWEWPGGSILEVSTKVPPDDGQATYTELKNLAASNGLALNTTQRSKTGLTLEQLTAPHPK